MATKTLRPLIRDMHCPGSYKRVAAAAANLSYPIVIELDYAWLEEHDIEISDLELSVDLVSITDAAAGSVVAVEPVQAVVDEKGRNALCALSIPDTIAVGGYYVRVRVTDDITYTDTDEDGTETEVEIDADDIAPLYRPFLVVAA